MAEGAKRAHSDLNITVDGPVENLDIVTEQPRDYSAEMELAYAKNQNLAPVFGHLGNIADNANDLNRTINAYDFEVDYKDRAEEQKLEQDRLDAAQALDIFNTVSAKRAEMVAKIEEAKEQALNTEGGDILASVQGVLEEYRDSFSDSLEGSQMWSKMYEQEYLNETTYGIRAKYEVEHAKMYHNISQIQNELYRNIVLGNTDIADGMSQLIVKTSDIQNKIPAQTYQNIMDNCFNQLVLAKATNLAKVANGENAVEVANSIRELVEKYGKRTFDCYGTNGQKLIGSDGQPVTYTATLTPETVEKLMATAQTYENKTSSTGAAGATKTYDGYVEYVGGKSIEKSGFSDYLATATPESARQDYDSLVSGIQNNPNLTNKQKITQIQKVSQYYGSRVQPAVAAVQVMKLTPNSKVNYNKLLAKQAELTNALVSREDLSNFSMEFDLEGGKTFTLKPPTDFASMGYADPKMAAHNYWSVVKDTIDKTLKAKNLSDFVYTTNADYNKAVQATSYASGLDQLVQTIDGKTTIIKSGQDRLTAALTTSRQAHIDAVGSSGKAPTVPKKTLDDYVSGYLQGDASQKNAYANAWANALIDSKYTGFLLPQAELNLKSADEKQAFQDLYKHMYASAPGLADIQTNLTLAAEQGYGSFTKEQAKQHLKDNGIKPENLTSKMSSICREYKIPANQVESFTSAMSSVAGSYAVLGKSITEIEDALEAMAKNNFIDVKSDYLKSRVYIGNPALLQDGSRSNCKEQAKSMGKMVDNIGNSIHSSLNKLGIATKKEGIAADFDATTGRVTFTVNDELLGLSNETLGKFGSTIGIPYNFMATKPANYSETQWTNEVADYISTSAALSFVATDKMPIDSKLGQYGVGNIDLYNRPQVQLPNGSIATVQSMSFNENGKEVLIPMVSDDGKILSEKDAIAAYKKSGKHFGRFNTVKEANEYADLLHLEQERLYVNNPNMKTESKLKDPLTKQKISKDAASADAIKLLSVMQRDSFLKDYSNVISSGGKIGITPAPRAIKDLFKKFHKVDTQYISGGKVYDTKEGVIAAPQHISTMLDFAYSKSEAHNKVNLTVNKPLSYDMRGLNFTGVMSAAHKNGFVINRDYDQKKYGNYVSNHSKGMALDFGVNSNSMIDKFSGRVSIKSMENFTNMILKNPAYGKKVDRILTSRPELLDNKPEYADYAKFRNMKNSQGKPLFVDARKIDREKKLDHTNHFHVDFKEQVVDAKHQDFTSAFPVLAEDMANTSIKSSVPLNNTLCKALLYTFGDRYNNAPNARGEFGMANLTMPEYQMLGLDKNSVHDPTLQARVLANRYQAYANALGDADMAIFALAGAKFSDQSGKIMSIQEILNSGKIGGVGGQKYTLAIYNPKYKADPAEQARLNAIYRKYGKAYRNN